LLGTVAGDQANAVAVIEDKKKRKQDLYKVGDSVQDALIKKILRGKVVLEVGGKDEILAMEETTASSSSSTPGTSRSRSTPANIPGSRTRSLERTISLRRNDIDESLQDINALLSQARILPHFENGEADGLAVTGIKAGSIFMKMGLRNGDIVNGVNDSAITSPEDIMSMYSDMQSGSSLSIQIKRGGRERTINYRFLE
jgi:general secretion pathway protein C